MPRNVYIFTSFHHTPPHIQNLVLDVDSIFAVLRGLYEQIIRTDRKGISFFHDGLTESIAEVSEDYVLGAISKLSKLKGRARTQELERILEVPVNDSRFRKIDPVEYEFWQILKLFAFMRSLGFDITFKPTEPENYGRLSTSNRDKRIYKNIVKYGTETNILFVGSDHKLSDLRKSPDLECYRVEVESTQLQALKRVLELASQRGYGLEKTISDIVESMKKRLIVAPIQIFGTIPRKYQSGFELFREEFERTKGRALEVYLNYV